MAFSQEEFERKVADLTTIKSGDVVACAVSGGPDSMALLYSLSLWATTRDVRIAAFTIDHGLRAESAAEAQTVASWARAMPQVTHEILLWEGVKPQSRILEEARAARYRLLSDAMRRIGARYVFVAHHQDDQAETFLIRLAKGSGLDGLSGMREIQAFGADQWIVRPLLGVTKADLIAFCEENTVSFVNDPTNDNKAYLRPRLRAAQSILEEEGLSSKRLSMTARRMLRARDALDALAAGLRQRATRTGRDEGVMLEIAALREAPEELVLRVFLSVMDELRPESDYGPRMEKAESLLERFLHDDSFNGATLGGCIFAIDRKNGTVWIRKESAS